MKAKTDVFQTIKLAQENDNDALEKAIQTFMPLIKKFSYKTKYEDMESDLILCLIELIKHIDLEGFKGENSEYRLIAYIFKSIKNKYIWASKRWVADKNSLTELQYETISIATYDNYKDIDFFMLINPLTELQKKVIISLFYMGFSVSETADFLGISRQAVNQCKKRALQKLKEIVM